jgi:hypothetical protein
MSTSERPKVCLHFGMGNSMIGRKRTGLEVLTNVLRSNTVVLRSRKLLRSTTLHLNYTFPTCIQSSKKHILRPPAHSVAENVIASTDVTIGSKFNEISNARKDIELAVQWTQRFKVVLMQSILSQFVEYLPIVGNSSTQIVVISQERI